MRHRWLAILALVLAPLAGGAALAHQQKIAISSITVNPRTERLEVIHQVPVHDAEHALKRQGIAADIIASDKSREAFASYVARRFKLEAAGKPVPLSYIGSEIIGGNLMVYQEAARPRSGAMLSVNSQILTDVWARQENRVNIGSGTKVRTFVFTVNEPARSFQL